MKIYFVTFEFWPGVYNCFSNLKKLLDANFPDVQSHLISLDPKSVTSFIINNIKKNPPDILFLGGWDTNIKTILLNCPKKTKTAVYWCSPMTQVDLSDEGSRFQEVFRLTNQGKIDNFILPLETDSINFKKINDRVMYVPIYMDLKDLESNKIASPDRSECMADIFCAPCSRKNIINQICAMLPYRSKAKLVLNYNNKGGGSLNYINFAEMFYENYTNLGWLNRKEYLAKIQEMTMGLQVTLSESFNYVVGEHLYYGIPILVSAMSPFANSLEPYGLVIKNPQDSVEISNAAGRILSLSEADRSELSNNLHRVVVEENARREDAVKKSLREIIER